MCLFLNCGEMLVLHMFFYKCIKLIVSDNPICSVKEIAPLRDSLAEKWMYIKYVHIKSTADIEY